MKIIQHQELGSTQASITFSSIPQTYTDLVIKLSQRGTNSDASAVYLEFNGVTTGYTALRLLGDGGSASSGSFTTGFFSGIVGSSYTANTFDSTDCYIPNYTSANTKTYTSEHVTENNSTTSFQAIYAGLSTGTSAITQIVIKPFAGSFVQYTSATLYGVTKGSDGIVTVS
jgi:hypothetical protein